MRSLSRFTLVAAWAFVLAGLLVLGVYFWLSHRPYLGLKFWPQIVARLKDPQTSVERIRPVTIELHDWLVSEIGLANASMLLCAALCGAAACTLFYVSRRLRSNRSETAV